MCSRSRRRQGGCHGCGVGVAGVVPPIQPKPELKDVKGICDVRRTPVFADQARCKNQWGAYVHAQCASEANLTQPYQQTAVPQSAHAELEGKSVKELREVCMSKGIDTSKCSDKHDLVDLGAQFTCCTSTKVQILTQTHAGASMHSVC
jgi:hypothetical protein